MKLKITALLILSVFFVTIQSQSKKEFRITGLLQDSAGQPMPNSRVELTDNDNRPSPNTRGTTSDSEGRFVFHGVKEGKYLVSIPANGDKYGNFTSIAGSSGGYASVNVAGDNQDIVLQALPPTPVITGKIVDKRGKKVEGAEIRMCLVSDPQKCSGAIIEDDGSFSVAAPADEPFTFSVIGRKAFRYSGKDANGVTTESIILRPGERKTIKIN